MAEKTPATYELDDAEAAKDCGVVSDRMGLYEVAQPKRERLKQKFKQTEVGLIPEDWEVSKIKPLLASPAQYGANAPACALDAGKPLYLRITDITEEGLFRSNDRVSVDVAPSPKLSLEPGDLVVARTGASVGKSFYLSSIPSQVIVFAGFLVRLRPDPATLNASYLSYHFQSSRYWSWVKMMSTRSGQPGVNAREYAEFQIPLPTLPEQQAIAGALSDVDELLGALDRLIAKKRDLKQAAMQELLTGKRRLPGFTKPWETKALGEVAEFRSGEYLPKEAYRDGPFDVEGAGSPMGSHAEANFDQPITVLGRVGTVGKPRYKAGGCWVNNNAAAMVAMVEHSTPFYLHLLLLGIDWNQVRSVTAQPFLVTDSLLALEYCLPDVDEQAAIASILSDMDEEIAALESRREKTRLLKQGMMQELLTGRIRLVEELT